MAKIDFSDALKKAGNAAKKAAEKVNEVAQVGVEKAQDGAKSLMDGAKKETDKLSESVKSTIEQKKADYAEKQSEKKAAAGKAAIEASGVIAIAPKNAVKIFYYLMAIDKEIKPEEEELFNLIGKELDPDFEVQKDALIKECNAQIDKVIDVVDYYDVIQEGVDIALSKEQISNCGFITPKLLLWDLLTITYGDNEYSEEERKLIKYIVRKLNIAKDVFLEMESSISTVSDIEKEITWIKSTDRSYLVIEKQVKELEKRRADIMLAIKALIML